MTRTQAVELCLVNWKGVFCESYGLDRHVTALEGANGSGKTTVMIAAYLVLFPDLSRLRFTNLGESAGTGGDKGIWGRLGEPGRPSYVGLRLLRGDGTELLIGVHALRKAEPTLELTPFMFTGLRPDLRTQSLLLRECETEEEVPTLRQLTENAAKAGVDFAIFPTIKDYFSALFELGISPLRLSTDEEKGKFNDMLRTSMTGGISRALTSELRSFLLKEESGLMGTLGRMSSNLDACRRTRTEVGQARLLEHEISGIYAAGQAMFTRAVLATQTEIHESGEKLERARRSREEEEARCAVLEAAVHEGKLRHAALTQRLGDLRASLTETRERTRQVERNQALRRRLTELQKELEDATTSASEAEHRRAAAAATRVQFKQDWAQAEAALLRSAEGLANLQNGLEELHRRAHAQRTALARLAEVRALLNHPGFEPDSIPVALSDVSERTTHLDQERARREREGETAKRRASDHSAATQALHALCGDLTPDSSDLYQLALNELRRWDERERLSQRLDELLQDEKRKTAQLQQREQLLRRLQQLDASYAVEPTKLAAEARDLEERLLVLEQTHAQVEARVAQGEFDADSAARSVRQLQETTGRWAQVALAQKRAEAVIGPVEVSLEAIRAAESQLDAELRRSRRELDRWLDQREAALAEASLVAVAGSADSELLRLRDLVDGELLAERFEDLEIDEACRVQAELGPLANALVVLEPEAVLEKLAAEKRDIPSVWLVKAGAELGLEASRALDGAQGGDVVVRTEWGLRITRVDTTGTLSRRARERRAELAGARAEALGAQIDALNLWVPRSETARAALEILEREFELWQAGDPTDLEVQARARYLESTQAKDACRQEVTQGLEQIRVLSAKVKQLRPLVAEAWLFEQVGEGGQVLVARSAVAEARVAKAEVAAKATSIQLLREHLQTLAVPPPDQESLERWAKEREALAEERDRLFALAEALSDLSLRKHALSWDDAPQRLQANTQLVPELEAQHEQSRKLLQAVEKRAAESEATWERLTAEAQSASATQLAIIAHLGRATDELGSEPNDSLSEDALDVARSLEAQTQTVLDAADLEERSLMRELALREDHQGRAGRALETAKIQEKCEADQRAPAEAAWARLRAALEDASVLGNTLSPDETQALSGAGSMSLWAEARSKRELLSERLGTARGGGELAESLRQQTHAVGSAHWEPYLEAWLSVRKWLRRRLPPQVAEVADPLEALGHLGADLGRLEGRLLRQETDLRGTSEDVARSIEVQLRKATGQVRRLNQYLEGVHFGSIAGIRVQLGRVERMEQVLTALRTGSAQELLFQSNLPIEEALDEIFRRYGGGRTGGQKLLDYREYIDLGVEVRRQSKEQWEPANPTQVSTGEAIGVGAALMMVILTEWERDANLLRPRRTDGCLRFLFLDEANRLSQDNLAILFDLCENLDLQLLIAAPEVARSEGNTTYRLVRRFMDDGTEEVLVSGRRASMPAWPPTGPVPTLAAEQQPLEPTREVIADDSEDAKETQNPKQRELFELA